VSGHPEERRKPLSITLIPCVKGISENFRCIGDSYNFKTVFKTKHSLWDMLMRAEPARSPHQMENCICSIPCECGRNCIGEMRKWLAVWLWEHGHNLRQGILEKSKLAEHACEEGHMVSWDGARILQIANGLPSTSYKSTYPGNSFLMDSHHEPGGYYLIGRVSFFFFKSL
jgi:hypothetical protein